MKNILFCICTFISILSNAQTTQRFVEFEISDTLSIMADELEYSINFFYDEYQYEEDYDYRMDKYKRAEEENKIKDLLNDATAALEKLIKNYKLNFVKSLDENANKRNLYRSISIGTVYFKGTDKFKAFVNEVKKINNLTSYVNIKKSSQTESALNKLAENLYAKAKAKALIYTNITQTKLGKVLQIIEKNQDLLYGEWGVRKPKYYEPRYGDDEMMLTENEAKIVLFKSIQIRFELE